MGIRPLIIAAAVSAAALGVADDAKRAQAQEAGGGSKKQVTLKIEGEPGTEYSGMCSVGSEKDELGGRVPQQISYTFAGEKIECEVRQQSAGALEVVLESGDDRSEQRISSEGGTIKLAHSEGSISSTTTSSTSSSSSSGASGGGFVDATDASGDIASEARDVSGFDEVELSGVGNLSIRQTGTESLSVRAEEDVLPKIRTEVVDGRLLIGPEPNTSIETTEPIDYELTVDNLRALELSGSGNVDAEGIDTDQLVVDISGSGAVKTSGRAESQEVHVSGAGDYDAQDLESKRVRIEVEGAGSAVVNASEELDAKVGGTGFVEYVGDPTIEQDVSGVGRVSKR